MASSRKSPKNSTLLARVSAVLKRHAKPGDRLVVGLSGGIDSVVLLDLMVRATRRHRCDLAAMHVNHQINPSARQWARFCRALCKSYDVPLSVRTVVVKRGNSLEASARAARYRAFATVKADAIVLAHNLDDQVETLLLQLLRGAGVKGVAAMPEFRIQDSGLRIEASRAKVKLKPEPPLLNPAILRPLLEVPRSEILAYAQARKLKWIEDDSNLDTAFDRNFMRHEVLPLIASRYPAYRQTLLRASRNFAEAAYLIDSIAVADAGDTEATLDLRRLRRLPVLRVKNVLRQFLASHGVAMPNARRLEECARQLMQPGADTRFVLSLGGRELRRHGDIVLLTPAREKLPGSFENIWQGEKNWQLPELGGVIVMARRRGKGLSLAKLSACKIAVRARSGGERLQPDPARPRRTLKNLFQEQHIPEWQRDRLPLMYANEALIYAEKIGVDATFLAVPGEIGIEPEWRPVLR